MEVKTMPSAKILAQKQAATEALTEKVKAAVAGVLVNYTGITVEQDTALRNELRKAGVDYHVYKNTMTARACEAAGYGEMKQYLEGMNAFAISESDPIAAAKILKEYADKIETFNLVAGFVDGNVIDAKQVEELAKTPSKEVLLGRLLGSLQAPLYSLARVLTAVTEKDGAEAPAAE
jgi:large subunit ribosomal protein L10